MHELDVKLTVQEMHAVLRLIDNYVTLSRMQAAQKSGGISTQGEIDDAVLSIKVRLKLQSRLDRFTMHSR